MSYYENKADRGKIDPFDVVEDIPLALRNPREDLLKSFPLFDGFLYKAWLEAVLMECGRPHNTLGIFEGLAFGEKKYSRYSWRGTPDAQQRYMRALGRHLCYERCYGPSEVDSESGIHHLSLACANAAILLDLDAQRVAKEAAVPFTRPLVP